MASVSRFLVLIVIGLAALAADTTVKGYLVDQDCGYSPDAAKAVFGAKHTKACLQMPDCERSGYGVLTGDRKVISFDRAGNDRAKEFISELTKQQDVRVIVTGSVSGNTMTVAKIELQ